MWWKSLTREWHPPRAHYSHTMLRLFLMVKSRLLPKQLIQNISRILKADTTLELLSVVANLSVDNCKLSRISKTASATFYPVWSASIGTVPKQNDWRCQFWSMKWTVSKCHVRFTCHTCPHWYCWHRSSHLVEGEDGHYLYLALAVNKLSFYLWYKCTIRESIQYCWAH